MRAAFGEDVPAGLERLAAQQGQETFAGDARGHRQAGGLQAGRRHILAGNQRARFAARPDDARPPGKQGHVQAGIVQRALAAGEGHAVVASEQEERVVERAAFPQQVEDALEVAVHVLDLAQVASQVLPDFGQVRQ